MSVPSPTQNGSTWGAYGGAASVPGGGGGEGAHLASQLVQWGSLGCHTEESELRQQIAWCVPQGSALTLTHWCQQKISFSTQPLTSAV